MNNIFSKKSKSILIKDFILSNPKRPYHEVESYMKEIEAGNDDFKEAIIDVADALFYPSSPRLSGLQKDYVSDDEDTRINTNTSARIFNSENSESKDYSLRERKFGLKLQEFLKEIVSKRVSNSSLFDKFQNVYSSKVVMLGILPIALIIIVSFSLYSIFNTKKTFKSPVPTIQSLREKNLASPALAAYKVPESKKEIDANQVFSFPQSNITTVFRGRPNKEVLGFFPYWMLDNNEEISLEPYTQISLFGLTVNGKGEIITKLDDKADGGWTMWNSPKLTSFINRARKNNIKILLTFKSFNNDDIEKLVLSDAAQKTFISNAVQFVNSKSLNGINIDFEYFGTPDDNVKLAFVKLIANLNNELKRQLPKSTLSIDTYLKSGSGTDFFDVNLLQNYVDTIVVMGYDVHTANGDPGPIAPMEGSGGVLGYMQSYFERVAPEKLILAVAYYGYDWPVDKTSGDSKILSFAEISDTSKKLALSWDDQYQAPFYQYNDPETKSTREVHFENTRSLGIKYDFVKKKNLAGIGIWAMGYDGKNNELEQVLLEKFTQ